MKFIEEKSLVEAFWKKYGYRKNILKHQFECKARKGGIDLFTIEKYNETIYFCSFEFKLDDMKKALAQAEENLKYSHKSFVVVPQEKVKVITDKYSDWLKEKKYIGVIGVELDGKWNISHKALMQSDDNLTYNQEIIKLMLGNI